MKKERGPNNMDTQEWLIGFVLLLLFYYYICSGDRDGPIVIASQIEWRLGPRLMQF